MYEITGLLWMAVVVFYAYKLHRLRLCKMPQLAARKRPEQLSLSIVIPFRNEAKNLPVLLQSLKRALPADYPVEVIGVDDFSQDDSADIFRRNATGLDFKLLTSQRQSASPKRDAQTRGIAAAKGRWILLLDADTQVPPHYFRALKTELLARPEATFRPGPVAILPSRKGFWGRWQQWENIRLQSLTRFSALCGKSLMANGAHLLFRRDRFDALKGFAEAPDVAGGDDMYLLLAWKRRFPGEILPLGLQPELIVRTDAESGFGALLGQRLRWARKTRRMQDADIRRWAMGQSLLFAGFFLGLGAPLYWLIANLLWWVNEYVFGQKFRKTSAYRVPVWCDVLFYLITPLLYLLVFLAVWLPFPIRWKGRKFKM